jgi:hypothetical protein
MGELILAAWQIRLRVMPWILSLNSLSSCNSLNAASCSARAKPCRGRLCRPASPLASGASSHWRPPPGPGCTGGTGGNGGSFGFCFHSSGMPATSRGIPFSKQSMWACKVLFANRGRALSRSAFNTVWLKNLFASTITAHVTSVASVRLVVGAIPSKHVVLVCFQSVKQVRDVIGRSSHWLSVDHSS